MVTPAPIAQHHPLRRQSFQRSSGLRWQRRQNQLRQIAELGKAHPTNAGGPYELGHAPLRVAWKRGLGRGGARESNPSEEGGEVRAAGEAIETAGQGCGGQ